ncbi:MAG: hypothetical protein IJ592_04545 [Candidatus Methanomethylophilaceae archaeon]|nr:hypothetical protein [Candidatus Methanomethylophilaceae archaeon]
MKKANALRIGILLRRSTDLDPDLIKAITSNYANIKTLCIRIYSTDDVEGELRLKIDDSGGLHPKLLTDSNIELPPESDLWDFLEDLVDEHNAVTEIYLLMRDDIDNIDSFVKEDYTPFKETIDIPEGYSFYIPVGRGE